MNQDGEWLAETPQRGIRAENGLRKLRKGESKRRMACGNPARENPNGEWLAETPQRGIGAENGLRKFRKARDKQQIRQTNKKGKL